jgi:hypothetical protein
MESDMPPIKATTLDEADDLGPDIMPHIKPTHRARAGTGEAVGGLDADAIYRKFNAKKPAADGGDE